jgi:DNA-binding NarL/FixJ family response regulator
LNELDKRGIRRVTFLDADGYNNLGEDSFKLAEACQLKQERRNLLMEKLAELGKTCQQLLRLSWDGHPMEEVAHKLNLTYGFARKKKSECMSKLITLIKQSPKFNSLSW